MAHEKYETNPWHKRSLDVFCNRIGSDGANEDRSDPIPEAKEADKIKKGDTE